VPGRSSGCRTGRADHRRDGSLPGRQRAGVFLVQAEPCGFDYVGPDQPVLPDDSTEEDEDDFDAFAFPDNFGGFHDAA